MRGRVTLAGAKMVLVTVLILIAAKTTSAQDYQVRHAGGQNIAPAFEGWEPNPDGSFSMVFGYFNRNWEERPHVPIGPDNMIEPGGPDQGQPTYFFPRRNKFTFRVRVPRDFGDKELVWTLTVNGKTATAYATLKPEYVIDDGILIRNYANTSPADYHDNQRPVLSVEGETDRTVKVGEPLALTAVVSDDGLLAPKPARPPLPSIGGAGYYPALGLRVAWFVYRGPGDKVTFDPDQFEVWDSEENSPWASGWTPPALPADGKHPVQVTFHAPGAYVVRVLAHDGIAVTQEFTVQVVN